MRIAFRRSAFVAVALAVVAAVGTAHACVSDPECDDGDVCNGAETCNVGLAQCESGTPPPDSTPCDAGTGVTCTLIDTCQAGTCVPGGGGDSDGDDLCDADDNCPLDANAGQEDFDADEIGNICDDEDGTMEVTLAKLKFDKAKPGRRSNGRILVKGEFLTSPPLDTFDPGTGLLVRIQDNLNPTPLDQSFSWQPGECETRLNGKGEVRIIKCKTPDNRFKANLSPHRVFPAIIRVKVLLKQLPKEVVPGPFFGPVTVTVTTQPAVLTEGVDRVGAIVDCKQVGNGLKCRE